MFYLRRYRSARPCPRLRGSGRVSLGDVGGFPGRQSRGDASGTSVANPLGIVSSDVDHDPLPPTSRWPCVGGRQDLFIVGGRRRIWGEPVGLGLTVAASTVWKIMEDGGGRSGARTARADVALLPVRPSPGS